MDDGTDRNDGTGRNDGFDMDTQAVLSNALENAKSFYQTYMENKEKRLWRKVDIPCSLHDAINRLTKYEMDRIRKNYRFEGLSTLNKAGLAAKLAALIPLNLERAIYALDQGRYRFIRALAQNSGVMPDVGIKVNDAESFMAYSLFFTGTYEDQKILFMPEELLDAFLKINDNKLEEIVRRNTEWIRLTHGMLHYYGVMDALPITVKIKELTGSKADLFEYMNVMSFACDFYGQARHTVNGYRDDRVFDPQKIVKEHRMRPGVNYYPFTRKQLLKAGDSGYFDRTPEMNNFISFLLRHYKLTDQETNEIALQITNMINADSKPALMIKYLESWLEIPSFEFGQQLIAKIMVVNNNTHQWALKGHTPKELFQEEKKYLNPLPVSVQADPFRIRQTDSDILNNPDDLKDTKANNLLTRTKVGRNDPCPCGSGKKYKKCCGK